MKRVWIVDEKTRRVKNQEQFNRWDPVLWLQSPRNVKMTSASNVLGFMPNNFSGWPLSYLISDTDHQRYDSRLSPSCHVTRMTMISKCGGSADAVYPCLFGNCRDQ